MSKTIFSRRLGNDETEIWIGLLKERTSALLSEDLIASFSSLENGLFYVSSFNDDTFGGSAVFIDRYRLGMALIDIIIKSQYIDETGYVVIKSSIPYFRSLSIKNVDVLVNSSGATFDLPFPLAFGVDPCMIDTLEKIGFEAVHELYHVTIDNISEIPTADHDLTPDDSLDIEGSLKFYWSHYKQAGVDCSHFWCAFDLSLRRKNLNTLARNNRIIAILGCEVFDNQLIVAPFLIDTEAIYPHQMISLLSSIAGGEFSRVDFPIAGTGQLDYIQEIARVMSGEISTRELQLMRKKL